MKFIDATVVIMTTIASVALAILGGQLQKFFMYIGISLVICIGISVVFMGIKKLFYMLKGGNNGQVR